MEREEQIKKLELELTFYLGETKPKLKEMHRQNFLFGLEDGVSASHTQNLLACFQYVICQVPVSDYYVNCGRDLNKKYGGE